MFENVLSDYAWRQAGRLSMWRSLQLWLLRGQRLNLVDALEEARAKNNPKQVDRILTMLVQTDMRIAKHEAKNPQGT